MVQNGFTKFPNDLYDQILLFDFSKRQAKIVHAVVRYTYGFGRNDAEMSTTFLATKTGVDRGDVSKALVELFKIGVLVKHQQRVGYTLGINKKLSAWGVLVKHQHDGETPALDVQNTSSSDGETPAHIKKTIKKTIKEKDLVENRPLSDYVDAWNFIARKFGWSQVQKLTGQRTIWLKTRIADPDFDWKKILHAAIESKGLHAQQWFGFDFLVRNDTHFVQVLEGKYSRRFDERAAPKGKQARISEEANEYTRKLNAQAEANRTRGLVQIGDKPGAPENSPTRPDEST